MKIAVIGGGFVGLQIAVHSALLGHETVVIDISERVVEAINSGERLHVRDRYIVDNWSRARERLRASTNYEEASGSDAFILSVNTPLRAHGRKLIELLDKPLDQIIDFSPVHHLARSLAGVVRRGSVVASEITIYPGGTEERIGIPLQERTGLEIGKEVALVHSPERINPDDEKWNVSNIPRVLGGVSDLSTKEGLRLYGELKIPIAAVTGIREAELSKLIENAQRLVNIAFVSSVKIGADATKIAFPEALRGASTKPFGFQAYRPGYAGGPCLPKDTIILYAWLRDFSGSSVAELLRAAIVENELYIEHLASRVETEIRERGAKRVLFYGLGYKPGSRYFISEGLNGVWRVIALLRERGIDARVYDEAMPERSDFSSLAEAKEWAELVVGWGRGGDLRLEEI